MNVRFSDKDYRRDSVKVMALSLLQGYSSPSEASESDSDDSDDGIVITIDRNVLNGGRPGQKRIFFPLSVFVTICPSQVSGRM